MTNNFYLGLSHSNIVTQEKKKKKKSSVNAYSHITERNKFSSFLISNSFQISSQFRPKTFRSHFFKVNFAYFLWISHLFVCEFVWITCIIAVKYDSLIGLDQMAEGNAQSRYVKLTKDQAPLEDITPGELNQPVQVPQVCIIYFILFFGFYL